MYSISPNGPLSALIFSFVFFLFLFLSLFFLFAWCIPKCTWLLPLGAAHSRLELLIICHTLWHQVIIYYYLISFLLLFLFPKRAGLPQCYTYTFFFFFFFTGTQQSSMSGTCRQLLGKKLPLMGKKLEQIQDPWWLSLCSDMRLYVTISLSSSFIDLFLEKDVTAFTNDVWSNVLTHMSCRQWASINKTAFLRLLSGHSCLRPVPLTYRLTDWLQQTWHWAAIYFWLWESANIVMLKMQEGI